MVCLVKLPLNCKASHVFSNNNVDYLPIKFLTERFKPIGENVIIIRIICYVEDASHGSLLN